MVFFATSVSVNYCLYKQMASFYPIFEFATVEEESAKIRSKMEREVFSMLHIRVTVASGFLAWAACWLSILNGYQVC